MDDMVTLVLDSSDDDEYMYKRNEESDADYKARMTKLRERRNARMTEEEKRLVAEVLNNTTIASAV